MFTLVQVLFAPLLFIAGTVALGLEWPNYPERGQNFSLRWSDGTPPYVVYVLKSNLQDYYYKYQGSDNLTYWTFDVPVGTQVYFQVIDSTSANRTSRAVTVIGPPSITYPPDPPSGVNSSISWTGGWPPYKVNALSADLQLLHRIYEGADTSVSWDCELDPGTRIAFQVVDNQGIKDTGFLVTVASNPASTTGPSSLSTSSPSTTTTASVSFTRGASSATTTKHNHTRAIAIAIGVVGFLLLAAGIAFFFHKKRSSRPTYASADSTLQLVQR